MKSENSCQDSGGCRIWEGAKIPPGQKKVNVTRMQNIATDSDIIIQSFANG